MKKYEKVFLISLTVAVVGILLFWIVGFNGHKTMSVAAFFIAGVSAWVGLIAKFIGWLRYRNLYGC